MVAPAGGAFGVGPPVVADKGDMDHIFVIDFFPASKEEINVLSSIVFRSESADFFHDVATDDGEVMRKIVGERHRRAPIVLELRIKVAARVIDLVFVGVEITGLRVLLDRLCDVEQRVFGQDVVVVEQGNELPGGDIKSRVGCARNMSVFSAENRFNSWIFSGSFFENTADVRLGRGIIRDAQFPSRVNLLLHALQ